MKKIVRVFNDKMVRIMHQDGNPWFVAKDICDVLGIKNNRDAIASLDNDEKNTVGISDGTPGNPMRVIINESGLYKLIMRSRKREAKKFVKWITAEVLPSIRKTGGYVAPNISHEQRDNLIEKLVADKVATATRIGMLEEQNRVLSHFEPRSLPGDVSSITGKEKWKYVRGYFTSGKGRPAASILDGSQPDLPGLLFAH
jgi:prophage antirepressor-like protein